MKEFNSFLKFAEHLVIVGVKAKLFEHEMLEHACELIEERSKEKIGEYQNKQGPFSEWAELADATKEDRTRQGYSENDPGLRSGQMRESIEHKVAGHEGHVGSDDDKLLWFELGTDKQPARSVLGGAAFELEPKIREETGLGFVAVLSGGKTRMAVR